MKRLFALRNIGFIKLEYENDGDAFIAYTEDLLHKNLLIEFYEITVGAHIETAIFAIYCDESTYNIFTLASYPGAVNPLLTYPIVVNAVEFIAACPKETVPADLPDISRYVDKRTKEGNLREVFELDYKRFQYALELINAEKLQK